MKETKVGAIKFFSKSQALRSLLKREGIRNKPINIGVIASRVGCNVCMASSELNRLILMGEIPSNCRPKRGRPTIKRVAITNNATNN